MQNALFLGPACTRGVSQCVLGPCLRAGYAHAAWAGGGSRSDALGAGRRCLAPRVGGDRWSSCSGRVAVGGCAGRTTPCLPTVRSRACVDAWAGEASGGSFRTVAPVAVWGLGLLLREALVDYRNAPDNAYSQGGQELNASAGAC